MVGKSKTTAAAQNPGADFDSAVRGALADAETTVNERKARYPKGGGPQPGSGRPKGTSKKTLESVRDNCLRIWASLPEHLRNSVPAEQRPGHGLQDEEDDLPPDQMRGDTDDPAEFMRRNMKNPRLDPKLRMRAAMSLLAHETSKARFGGKKQQKADRAAEVAGGEGGSKFKPTTAPQLRKVA